VNSACLTATLLQLGPIHFINKLIYLNLLLPMLIVAFLVPIHCSLFTFSLLNVCQSQADRASSTAACCCIAITADWLFNHNIFFALLLWAAPLATLLPCHSCFSCYQLYCAFPSGWFLFCQLMLLLLLPMVIYCIFVLDGFCLFTCFPVPFATFQSPNWQPLLPFLFHITITTIDFLVYLFTLLLHSLWLFTALLAGHCCF